MNAYELAIKAKEEIETKGGMTVGTALALEALGYDYTALENLIIKMIQKGK